MPNPQFVQIRKGACQRLRLDLIEMLGEPFVVVVEGNATSSIEFGQLLELNETEGRAELSGFEIPDKRVLEDKNIVIGKPVDGRAEAVVVSFL